MKKALKIFVIVWLAIYCGMLITNVITANVNYKINSKNWTRPEGYLIERQQDYKQIKFGFGNVAQNGCAPAALYDVLCLENKYTPLPNIIKKFDTYGEFFFGLLGSDPFIFVSIAQSYGLKVNVYFNSKNFDDLAKKSKYAIVFIVTPRGGHYQLITDYDETNQTYQCYVPKYRATMEGLLYKEKFAKNTIMRALYTIN